MTIEAELINGVGFGIQYMDDTYYGNVLIVELLFFRFLMQWSDN